MVKGFLHGPCHELSCLRSGALAAAKEWPYHHSHKNDPMEELREYKAIVWVGESVGQRVTRRAKDLKDAQAEINEQCGEGPDVVTSIWNEKDAKKTTLNIPKNDPKWE